MLCDFPWALHGSHSWRLHGTGSVFYLPSHLAALTCRPWAFPGTLLWCLGWRRCCSRSPALCHEGVTFLTVRLRVVIVLAYLLKVKPGPHDAPPAAGWCVPAWQLRATPHIDNPHCRRCRWLRPLCHDRCVGRSSLRECILGATSGHLSQCVC